MEKLIKAWLDKTLVVLQSPYKNTKNKNKK